MLTISIEHPDAEDFIDAKLDGTKVTGANVSVKIDDEFMEAVKSGKDYTQKFPIDSDNPQYTKTVNTKEIWDKIGKISDEAVSEIGNSDKETREIYESYIKARGDYRDWTEISDGQYIAARKAALSL